VSELPEQQSDEQEQAGVGLDEALAALRADLTAAHARAADSGLQFPVVSVTVELQVAVTRSAEGRAGFRVPLLGAELGGSGGRESAWTQTLTLTLGSPVDREGRPVKVARASDRDKG
jgi:hypothetical protein